MFKSLFLATFLVAFFGCAHAERPATPRQLSHDNAWSTLSEAVTKKPEFFGSKFPNTQFVELMEIMTDGKGEFGFAVIEARDDTHKRVGELYYLFTCKDNNCEPLMLFPRSFADGD